MTKVHFDDRYLVEHLLNVITEVFTCKMFNIDPQETKSNCVYTCKKYYASVSSVSFLVSIQGEIVKNGGTVSLRYFYKKH